MSETKLLLNAYYEALYERLEAKREHLTERIEKLLVAEVENRGFGNFDEEKYAAYREACLAFVDERLEMYNPIGVQYALDICRRQEAARLELQLDWYDSRAEFGALRQAAQARAEQGLSEDRVPELAGELIKEAGAFPDKSIISTYEAGPALNRLPDYIVARAIEELIR